MFFKTQTEMLIFHTRLLKTNGMPTKLRVIVFVSSVFIFFIENVEISAPNRHQHQQCWLMLVLVASLELFIFVVPGTTCKVTARRPTNQPATKHLASNDQQCWLVLVLVGILELFIIVLTHLFLEINAHV